MKKETCEEDVGVRIASHDFPMCEGLLGLMNPEKGAGPNQRNDKVIVSHMPGLLEVYEDRCNIYDLCFQRRSNQVEQIGGIVRVGNSSPTKELAGSLHLAVLQGSPQLKAEVGRSTGRKLECRFARKKMEYGVVCRRDGSAETGLLWPLRFTRGKMPGLLQ